MKHYALIGDPVGHSLSPAIYGFLFEKYGIDADFSLIRLPKGRAGDAVCMGLDGFACTMPHKQDIMPFLSSLSPDDINSLKSMAESIFGSQNEKETAAPTGQSSGFDSISPEMLIKISSVMNMMNNSADNEKCRLIEALRPNLSKKRQKKADEAMQMLKLLEILPIISELTNGGDNKNG